MTKRYLSAHAAAKLLKRCSCSESYIKDELIRKAEYAIRIAASKRCDNIVWRVPILYSSVPAYDFGTMQNLIVEHLRKQKFYVKSGLLDNTALWISWRFAFMSLTNKQRN